MPAQSQVVREDWKYNSPHASSSVPVPSAALYQQAIQQSPFDYPYSFTTIETNASHACSSDIGRSPPILSHSREVLIPSQASSMASSEFNSPSQEIHKRQLDQVGENVDAGAGIDMSFMEGFTDTTAHSIPSELPRPSHDLKAPSTEDDGFFLLPQNATAHTGGYFSAPANANSRFLHSPAISNEHWVSGVTDDAMLHRSKIPRYITRTDNPSEPYDIWYGARSDKCGWNEANSLPATQHHHPHIMYPLITVNGQTPTNYVSAGREKLPSRLQAHSNPQQAQSRTLLVNANVEKSRRRRSTAPSSKPNRSPLAPILEGRVTAANLNDAAEASVADSQPLSRTTSDRPRARRGGPLREDARTATADKRANESTCFNCKAQKIRVSGYHPASAVLQLLTFVSAWAIFRAKSVGTMANLACWQNSSRWCGMLRATANVRIL